MGIKLPNLKNIVSSAAKGGRAPANAVSNAVQKNVIAPAKAAQDGFDLPSAASTLWQAVTRPNQELSLSNIGDLLAKVDLKTARNVLAAIFPPRIRDADGDRLVAQTEPFRSSVSTVRTLEAELASMPKDDPRRPQLRRQLEAAEAQLHRSAGYTAKTAPKPGALWLDPQFLHRELPNGQVHASEFPTGTPVTRPPKPLEFLFPDRDRRFSLETGPAASSRSIRSLHGDEQYKAEVARNRAQLGMPVTDGEPMGVHMTFQGGGGKGKRYAAAMSEMYSLGVVPTSLSGSSAGAIAAALTATGADPVQLNSFVTDPRLMEFFDLDLRPDDGGLMNGNVAFDVIDQKLRELTGITDRPVTFADLKVPLKIFATKTYDSAPDKGTEDMTKVANRLFVFSQETTPDTPVVLAVRASMAIPGLFDPVQMVDPTTGRKVHLTDGGALDNLPTGNDYGLPEVGVSLLERHSNHPRASDNLASRGPLDAGNLDATHIVWNAFNGYALLKQAGGSADDFRDRTQPKPNQFMLSLPVWDLKDPSKANSTLGFGYDKDVDPALDAQTRQVTRNFFRNHLAGLREPGASGTNVTAKLPSAVRFDRVPVTVEGRDYFASYEGGDRVVLSDRSGKREERKLNAQKVEAIYLDHLAFGDLSAQLSHELSGGRGLFDWF